MTRTRNIAANHIPARLVTIELTRQLPNRHGAIVEPKFETWI